MLFRLTILPELTNGPRLNLTKVLLPIHRTDYDNEGTIPSADTRERRERLRNASEDAKRDGYLATELDGIYEVTRIRTISSG